MPRQRLLWGAGYPVKSLLSPIQTHTQEPTPLLLCRRRCIDTAVTPWQTHAFTKLEINWTRNKSLFFNVIYLLNHVHALQCINCQACWDSTSQHTCKITHGYFPSITILFSLFSPRLGLLPQAGPELAKDDTLNFLIILPLHPQVEDYRFEPYSWFRQ